MNSYAVRYRRFIFRMLRAVVLEPIAGYTRIVFITKNTLWAVAGLILVTIMLLPHINPTNTRLTMVLNAPASKEEVSKPVMMNPKLQGVDEQNQPYNVMADRAVQESEDVINLERVNGDITLKAGDWISILSRSGMLETKKGTLELQGEVSIFSDGGMQFHTEKTEINLKDRSAYSETPVEAQDTSSTITSEKFALENRGQKITFRENVRMHYFPQKAK